MSEISKYISHNDVKKKILIKDTENHIKTQKSPTIQSKLFENKTMGKD